MTRPVLILALLLGGCAGAPDNPLVWSDEVVRTLPLENGEAVEVARFSSLQPGAALAPWEPWFVRRGNAPTEYRVAQIDGVAALEADAREGGSGMSKSSRPARAHWLRVSMSSRTCSMRTPGM